MMQPIKKQEKQDGEIFRDIFRGHWEEFKRIYPSYNNAQYEDAVQKMLGCGDELGGYSEYVCPHCGHDIRRVAFSCKSCFCLSCSKKYIDDFVSNVSGMLHPGIIYRHIVLTIPEQLRQKFYHERHDSELFSKLMKCGYECLEDAISTAKRKDLKIGCIVVIQTHGRSGNYNPHLHIIMTSGGIYAKYERWIDLGYFKYEILHKKWQYHLLNMVRSYFGSEANQLVNDLWKKYPKGFVANVGKGEVPEKCRGLAAYLAKYVASPPIAVRRILSYDGQTVKYWYMDHKTKSKRFEVVDVMTFIGRMVQHIMPKWFHRVRYYGLQAAKTFNKWAEVIRKAVSKMKNVVKGAYQIVRKKLYRQRYQEISGHDPMICRYCGNEMELWRIWHPKYGNILDEYENLKAGKYDSLPIKREQKTQEAYSPMQLDLFPVGLTSN